MSFAPWGRWRYRAGQFFRGFLSSLSPEEIATVRALLSERELACFMAMESRDRRHSVDMVHWLNRNTSPSRELLAAALLHDVGKGRLLVWDRVGFVLLGALPGGLRDGVARSEGGRFRAAIWRLGRHAELGAARLAEVGAPPRVVALVARHTQPDPGGDEELTWLLAADAAC